MVSLLPWKVFKLKDLPRVAKQTLRMHQKKIPDTIADLEKKLGPNFRIGMVTIPMTILKLQVMNDPSRRGDFECFEEYHREYRQDQPVPRHKQRWPIVLSGTSWHRETIEDGWHRFHSYHRQGLKNVVALWYVDD